MTIVSLFRYAFSLVALGVVASSLVAQEPEPQPVCPLMDSLFDDLNGNGMRDDQEPALGGVLVMLSDCSGQVLGGTMTGEDGSYYFDFSSLPQQCMVLFPDSAGYVRPTGRLGGFGLDSLSVCFTMSAECQVLIDPQAQVLRAVSIGSLVWEDLNGDGVRGPNEPGLPDVTVQLCNAGGVVASAITGTDGRFLFSGQWPDEYYLKCALPPGSYPTLRNQGEPDRDSDALPNGHTPLFLLGSGQADLTRDIGIIRPGSIGDRTWNDLNGNGIQDPNEPGLPYIVVRLLDGTGRKLTELYTDAEGVFLFANLPPGVYRVACAAPAGFAPTRSLAGAAALDSDLNPDTAETDNLTMVSGLIASTIDLGFSAMTRIGDRVWDDRNANGIQDPSEPGLPGVRVQLLRCSTGALVATNVTSGADGRYAFAQVRPGSYKVRFIPPVGYQFTLPNLGTDLVDSNPNPVGGRTVCVEVTAGQANLTVDAGLRRRLPFTTYTPLGWGAIPKSTNAAAILTNCFNGCYGMEGIRVGGSNVLVFKSARAIQMYLPAGGTPRSLVRSYLDPIGTGAGSFGGNVLALFLNVDFSDVGVLPPGFGALQVAPGNKLSGYRVSEILALAQTVLGGDLAVLPAGCTRAELNQLVNRINQNFDGGKKDLGLLVP